MYDYLVIGSGPAGHSSAIRAAQLGLSVAIIDKSLDMLGGVCLNEGCIPAKSLYHSAELFNIIKNSENVCGIKTNVNSISDVSFFISKSKEAVNILKSGLSFLLQKNKIDIFYGRAEFVSKNSVKIISEDMKELVIDADKILIATGSSPIELSNVKFNGKNILSSKDVINMTILPESILIIGAGAIGVEFASYFNMLGKNVILVEAADQILPNEDKDIAKRLMSILKRKGIEVLTGSKVSEVADMGKDLLVKIENKNGTLEKIVEKVIVSVGRNPNTKKLYLENVGIKTDEKGFINTDKFLKTNTENIYAAGDVVSSPMLAHVGAIEGEMVANIIAGKNVDAINYKNVPNVVYSEPEISSIGLTEEEAKEKCKNIKVEKQLFKANGRSVAKANGEGFAKIIIEEKSKKIIGVHMIGENVSELIHEFAIVKQNNLTLEVIEKTIHAHPTLSEINSELVKAVYGKALSS